MVSPSQRGTAGGWTLTVYYTAVESFHSGPTRAVLGCLVRECANGSSFLGSYPADFVEIVKNEGTGRITSGMHHGMFLNWSIDTSYWLDSAPRDARGGVLEPYVSAAADPTLAFGTRFQIVDCGIDESTRAPIPAAVCGQLMSGRWVVRDRFSDPNVGKHLDLYIGEEDQPDFENRSDQFISTVNATISIS